MTYVQRGFFWIAVYLCLVLTPLFVLLLALVRRAAGCGGIFPLPLVLPVPR